MSQPPNPQEAKQRLLEAIQRNEPADQLLYQILCGASVQVGPVVIHVWGSFNQNLKEYAPVWLALTSAEGRKYIREQLDCLLDYIEFLVRQP